MMMRAVLSVLVVVSVSVIGACSSKDAPPPQPESPKSSTTTAAVDPHAGHGASGGAGAGADAAKGKYTCPMHPEVVSDSPGKCPKCKMALVSTAPQTPIEVSVTTTPAQPKAGEKTKLVFEMKSGGTRVSSFDVVHEKKLHLLMVTPDLSWFAHEHPEPQPDGTFVLEFAFPSGGNYRLFSDFKATDRNGIVLTTDVGVEGPAKPTQPLVASDTKKPRSVEGFDVRFTSPLPVAGVEKQMTFVVTKNKKPVTDLEPYLGAMGHLVVIGSDAKTFLHAHPEEHAEGHAAKPHVDPAGAPAHTHADTPGVVSFSTTFPKPGLYKAWAQFQVKGKPIIADFVFDVPEGAPGASPAAAGDGHGAHQH